MDTLDPKKKKIYVAVIAFCLLATAGVLFYGFGGGGGGSGVVVNEPAGGIVPSQVPAPDTGVPDTASEPSAGSGLVPLVSGGAEYAAPSIFPAEPRFDLSVYQSGALTALTDYTPLTVDPSEIGRDNPFLNY